MANKDNKEATKVDNAAAQGEVLSEVKPTVVKPRFGKQLASFTPFIKWYVGCEIVGEIIRKFSNNSGFGNKDNLEIRLIEGLKFIDGDGVEITLEKGDLINVGESAGLKSAMTLNVGNKVHIICTGQKELDKKRKPAWEFEVHFE